MIPQYGYGSMLTLDTRGNSFPTLFSQWHEEDEEDEEDTEVEENEEDEDEVV